MAKKNAQEAFEQIKKVILEDISSNLVNLQKSELNKSLFGLPSSTPPEAQVTKDAGLPVNSVFSVLSLGKGEEGLAKVGTMSHMMALGTKKNKPPVKVLKGDRSPKPAPAAASPVAATIKKGKSPKQSKAVRVAQAKAPAPNPNWANELGVTPAKPVQHARTTGIPSQLKMSHGSYQIQANADGSSSLLYTKKHKSPIMNLIFGNKPKDLGRFAHRAEAYDSLLGHHDQVAAGLIKDEESSNSEQSASVDPDSVSDMYPTLDRAKENIPEQSHDDSEELSAPGSGGKQSAKKTNTFLNKAAEGGAGPAPAAPTAAPAMPKAAAPKPSPLAPMPALKNPAALAGKQGYAYEVENQPTAIAAPQAPSINFKRQAQGVPQAVDQGGQGSNWLPGQKFQGRSVGAALGIPALKAEEPLSKPPVSEAQRRAMGAAASGHSTLDIPKSVGKEFIAADKGGKLPVKKNEIPTGPVQGAGAVTGDNSLDKSVHDPHGIGPGNPPKLSDDMKGISQTAPGPRKPEFTTSTKDGIEQTKPLGKTSMSPIAAQQKNAKMPTQQQIKPNIPGLLKAAEDLEKEFGERIGCKKCGKVHDLNKGCH